MAMSNYLEEKLTKHTYGGTSFTQPTAWYLALFSTDPTDVGNGTELSGSGYTRIVFTPTTPVTPAFVVSNTAVITFPAATANWSEITHVAIFDASTDGNMLDYGAITSPQTILTDGILKFLAGELDIQYT